MGEGATIKVKLVSDKGPKMQEALRLIRNREVVAGYPSTKTKAREKGEVITNASLAYIHDRGAPGANIPPRPFMVAGVELRRKEITSYMEKAATAALNGDPERVQRMLESAGTKARDGIKEKIVKGPFEELKKRTKAEKARKGYDPEKPLIRTGQLQGAVDFAVRPRGRT